MIVECSNCDTRFQLDDARVPMRGIRVRCSRCKEAFFLEHPDASKADVADDVAMRAVQGAAPDTTQDLPEDSAPQVSPKRGSPDPDEEEWEFNADLPSEDPNGSSAPESAAGDEFGASDDEFAQDEFEDDEVGEPEPDPTAEVDAVPGLGVDDISVDDDDMSSGLDLAEGSEPATASEPEDVESDLDASAVDAALADLGSDDASDFGEATDFSALAEDEPAEAVPEPAPAPSVAPESAPRETSEPEDWDFFSDESPEQPSPDSMGGDLGDATRRTM